MSEISGNELTDDENQDDSDDEKLSRYSDQVNSDIEDELYSTMHFFNTSDFSFKAEVDLKNNQSFIEEQNFINSCSVEKFTSSSSKTDINCVDISQKNVKFNSLNTSVSEITFYSIAELENKDYVKTKPISELTCVKDDASVSEIFPKQISNVTENMLLRETEDTELCKNDASDSSTSLYLEELPEKTDIIVNMKGTVNMLIQENDFSLDSSDNLDNSFVNTQNYKNRKLLKDFTPVQVINESFSSSSSADEILSKSLPLKFKKSKQLKINKKNAWQIDFEDKIPSRKLVRFFHTVKCTNCNAEGHRAKSCPKGKHRKCYICGDDHLAKQCNKRVCSFCYCFGHHYYQCPNRHNEVRCDICQLFGHTFDLCPDLWRRFHATTTPENILRTPNRINNCTQDFCYNCGYCGHLGHECLHPKSRCSSSPAWPFVISYDDPEITIRDKSCEKYQHYTPAHNSTPRRRRKNRVKFDKPDYSTMNLKNDSQYFQPQNVFSRKRKLFFEERNFQRTSNKHSEITESNNVKRKQKSKKKKKRANNRPLLSKALRLTRTC